MKLSYETPAMLERLLVQTGKISEEDLEQALLQGSTYDGGPVGALLATQKITEDGLAQLLAEQSNSPTLKYADFPEEFIEIPSLSPKFLKEHYVLPIRFEDGKLLVVLADPFDRYTLDNIRLCIGKGLKIAISTQRDILRALEDRFGDATMDEIIEDLDEEDLELIGSEEDEDIDHLRDRAFEAPVIRLVNLLISRAVEGGASDIHIEPFEGQLKIRYRADGVLHDVESPPRALESAIVSRVKIMADLNIAERRLPQDGRIGLKVGGKKIDLRVSTVPTLHGESVVMRVLDRESMTFSLLTLGFDEKTLEHFMYLIRKPHGIILVTGPTGSGKTTTLYAALAKINSPDKKIITVEDPVEYELPGVNQIEVKSKIGLTFASGLRSIVRQDPDIILIGEIRDLETAEIAIQSSLTGHLVFSTVHTNDAPTTITRLMDMGVENYLLASTIEGVLAQRLVRRLCPNCKESYEPTKQELMQIGISDLKSAPESLYRPVGCDECNMTGYKGRVGIYELLLMTDQMTSMILSKAAAHELRQESIRQGTRTLREDGWLKVAKGMTSISEVLRVTQEELIEV
ncbi:MAG: type II secretion system ATPase GspE [Candidatus Coatesbacteria bacterium]|nr:type II secretion system ATPase GspE [Candidatus Coatesbacteria bacterium]